MKNLRIIYLFVFVMIQFSSAQLQLKSSVISNGAGRTVNTNQKVKSTLGQPVIGIMKNNANTIYTGYWYNDELFTPIINDLSYLIPEKFELLQNYPNPFNPSTTIEFTLPKTEFVELKVFNILGKEVSTIVSNKLNQGNHTYTFDGTNLASGIYYYQLVAGDYREVKKMVLIR